MTQIRSEGVDLIAAERFRQITEEGYTPAQDAGRSSGLVGAGVSYGAHAHVQLMYGMTAEEALEASRQAGPPPMWPWLARHWKPTGDVRRDLVKAGALIAAAIDALPSEPDQ